MGPGQAAKVVTTVNAMQVFSDILFLPFGRIAGQGRFVIRGRWLGLAWLEVVYHGLEPIEEKREKLKEKNDILLGGALVAVSSILDEIAQQTQSLKVIKKEHFSILIEEFENLTLVVFTTKELKVIRKKMKEFLKEFYFFFEDLIKMEITNITSFLPAKKLTQRHFQYYW